jgi:hypothetical protein
MGCGTFNVKYDKVPFHKDMIKKIDSFKPGKNHESDEIEIQVVDEGKVVEKNELDEMTEKNITILKIAENDSTFEISPKKSPKNEVNLGKTENITLGNKVDLIPLNLSSQVKIEFENLPPDFDFSYLEAQSEPNEQDLLAEQVLREVSEFKL